MSSKSQSVREKEDFFRTRGWKWYLPEEPFTPQQPKIFKYGAAELFRPTITVHYE